MDLKLKDMVHALSTNQPIRMHFHDTGECCVANIGMFETYKELYVTSIWCNNSRELCLELKNEI